MAYQRDQIKDRPQPGRKQTKGYKSAKKAAKKAAIRRLRQWAKSSDPGQTAPGWGGWFH